MFTLSNDIARTFKRSITTALPLAALAAGLFAFLPFRGAAADSLDRLKDEVRTFHNHAAELYRLDKDDMEEIWSMYCGEFDPNVEKDKEVATALGRRLQDKEAGVRQQLITNEYSRLEKLAKQVAAQVTSSSDKEELEKLSKAAADDLKKLENLENGIPLKGEVIPSCSSPLNMG